jgi:anti-sigma-K factor RskA
MKTCWHHHAETMDRLTAEYSLGTLTGAARHRFESLMCQRPELRRQVWAWHERLGGLLIAERPLAAPTGQWQQIETRLFGVDPSPAQVSSAERPGWLRWLAPVPAAALALGLMMGTVVVPLWNAIYARPSSTQLPESYVGVLATADGKPGMIVSSLRKGFTIDLKQLAPVPVAFGATLYLWSIDKSGKVQGIGPVPNGKFVSATLPQAAEQLFFNAIELAVSVEPQGVHPDRPSGDFVYRGLCGKLWRLPTP